MYQNQKKDLRNAAPEQLAGLLEDLLELNDAEQPGSSALEQASRDTSTPCDQPEHGQE